MATSSNEPISETNELILDDADPAVSAGETLNADPTTGEPGSHRRQWELVRSEQARRARPSALSPDPSGW